MILSLLLASSLAASDSLPVREIRPLLDAIVRAVIPDRVYRGRRVAALPLIFDVSSSAPSLARLANVSVLPESAMRPGRVVTIQSLADRMKCNVERTCDERSPFIHVSIDSVSVTNRPGELRVIATVTYMDVGMRRWDERYAMELFLKRANDRWTLTRRAIVRTYD